MYACNTTYHIPFLDCLFLCFSSMCVTGLATVDLSTLSTFQQFIMYFQMLIGSMVSVAPAYTCVRACF
jgi:Trk-type K+ transport system membrane component